MTMEMNDLPLQVKNGRKCGIQLKIKKNNFKIDISELRYGYGARCTSGQKKIVENLPRNHINKTIFWIFDILSRYGEIGEQTDTQTDTHTDILTLFI